MSDQNSQKEEEILGLNSKERNKRIAYFSKLFEGTEPPERVTRFIYLDKLQIRNRNKIERTCTTSHGVFIGLKVQTRLSTIEKNFKISRRDMFFFNDSQMKASSIIGKLKEKDMVEESSDDDDKMSIYTEVLSDMHVKTLKEVVRSASECQNFEKIKYILENRDKFEWLEKNLRD